MQQIHTYYLHSLYLADTAVVLPHRVVYVRGCRLSLFAMTVCGVGFTGVSSGLVGSSSVAVVGSMVFMGFVMLVWSLRGQFSDDKSGRSSV